MKYALLSICFALATAVAVIVYVTCGSPPFMVAVIIICFFLAVLFAFTSVVVIQHQKRTSS